MIVVDTTMDWRDLITVDTDVCHGQACFRGSRLSVSVVLDNLAAGATPEQIRAEYPSMPDRGVAAALAYAADLASERVFALR